MDAAASEFYELDKTYRSNFSGENNGFSQRVSGDALKDFYKSLVRDYNVASIEEPFDKDDCESYSKLTTEIGERLQIVGDEFLVTDPKVSTNSFYFYFLCGFMLVISACNCCYVVFILCW